MKSGIYKITNTVNGRVYIGRAKYVKARWKRHIRELNSQKHHNQHLQADWLSSEPSAFSFELIEECEDNPEVLKDREAFWMRAYEAFTKGYNRLTDKNDFSGLKHSEETKKKMRAARLKYYEEHPEHKEKLSQIRKEEWASGQRTAVQNQNRVIKEETKKQISETLKQKHLTGEVKTNLEALIKGREKRKELTVINPDHFKKYTAIIRQEIIKEYQSLQLVMKNSSAQVKLAEKFRSNTRTIRAIVNGK